MAKQLSSFQPQLKSLLDGLVGYWKLDESSGNASDSSGNGYTLTNNSSVAFASGKINNGADFGTSGTTKSFTSTNMALFQGSGDFTFNTWVKINQQPSNTQQNFISIRATSSNGKRHFDYDYRDTGGTKEWNLWTGSTGGTFSQYLNTETLGVWRMVTVTYTSADGNLRGYIDGVLRNTTGTSTGDPAGNNFTIGNQDGNSRQVFGMQDEVGFWNRVLSPLELQALYNSGNAMAHPLGSTPNSTKLYMPLNGNSVDISGNGNHGVDTDISYVQGKFGQGASFTGSSQISYPNTIVSGNVDVTLSAWCYFRDTSDYNAVLYVGGASPNNSIGFYRNTGVSGTMQGSWNGGSGNVDSGVVISPYRWYYTTFIFNSANDTLNIYINGQYKATGSANAGSFSGTGANVIGRYQQDIGTNAWSMDGIIDEVIIENRAWTAQEISLYYRKSMLNYRAKSLFNLIKDFVMTGDTAVFTITGYSASLTLIQRLVAETANFVITGYEALLRFVGWNNQSKNISTFSNQSKNISTFSNQSKNNNSWTNQTKN